MVVPDESSIRLNYEKYVLFRRDKKGQVINVGDDKGPLRCGVLAQLYKKSMHACVLDIHFASCNIPYIGHFRAGRQEI